MRFCPALVLLALAPVTLLAQSVATKPRFDATDVHASVNATNPYTFNSGGILRGGRYDLRKTTVLDLISSAYGIDRNTIVGGPTWLEIDRFDVAGKAPANTPSETVKLMLRALLEDRFGLVLHTDTRPMPAFVLTTGKGKPKLREADIMSGGGCKFSQSAGTQNSNLSCRHVSMDAFAQTLSSYAGDYLTGVTANNTHLEGAWDFDIEWNPRSQSLPSGASRTTIFEAIDKQLGLSLQGDKVPQQVMAIDRMYDKPTPNAPDIARSLPPRVLEFEVATVKRSSPDEQEGFKLSPSGRFEFRDEPMNILLATAWDVDWDHVDEVISGIPKWARSTKFDIVAKTTAGTEPPSRTGFMDDDLRLMLRALLIDRFQMKTHYEERDIPAYTLLAAKPKMTKADPSTRAGCKQASVVANDPRDSNPRLSNLITCHNVTMAQFASQLLPNASSYLSNTVEDATGLSGAWDFTLSFSPKYFLQNNGVPQPGADTTSASDPSGAVSLFDAINKQLGLKLELRKRRVPVLVIDHMEENPKEN